MKIKINIIRVVILVAFIALWEVICRNNERFIFFFGLPSGIFNYTIKKILNGSLVIDFSTTFFEAVAGFILGTAIGTCIGLRLWFSKTAFEVSKPYIIALGSAPIFALAPLMIIWFGTGVFSKVMMATFSTLFIALFQAYSGASNVSSDHIMLLKTFNANKAQVFRKIILPSSLVWVISGFKLNIGFAILGAFIGEYLSSTVGLGHLILVASGLFDISLVLTGVLFLIFIALLLNFIIIKIEEPVKKLVVKLC